MSNYDKFHGKAKKAAPNPEPAAPVASATECTGLTPSGIVSAASAESYKDMYDIPLPNGVKRNDKKH